MKTPSPYHDFDKRITVYSLTETPDGYGGETTAEVSIGSMWASLVEAVSSGLSASGGEPTRAGTIYTEKKVLITTWYNSQVTPKCLVRWLTREFDILDVNDIENKHQYMQLFCVERGG